VLKLYSSIGPNPHTVRMFAAEKGIPLDIQEVDILKGENRQDWYYAVNPLGTTPALVLVDGTVVTETLASCEYLEEVCPKPALIGATPEERAAVRAWVRRIDLSFVLPLTLGFRASEGRPMFEPRMRIMQEAAAPDLKAMAQDFLAHIEQQCTGQDFIAGPAFSLADILLFCFVDFGRSLGYDMPGKRPWLSDWADRVGMRSSAVG